MNKQLFYNIKDKIKNGIIVPIMIEPIDALPILSPEQDYLPGGKDIKYKFEHTIRFLPINDTASSKIGTMGGSLKRSFSELFMTEGESAKSCLSISSYMLKSRHSWKMKRLKYLKRVNNRNVLYIRLKILGRRL